MIVFFFLFVFLLLVSQLLITYMYVYDNAQTNLPELVWYDMTSNGVVLFIIPEVVFLFHYEGKIFF